MLGLHHGVSLIKGPEQELAVPIIIGKGTMLVGERSAEASCTSRRAPEQRFECKSGIDRLCDLGQVNLPKSVFSAVKWE